MRKYETVFISDPDLKDQVRLELFDKIRDIITKEGGIILDFDEWGNKKLAYEIRKKTRGHYVCITYGGTGELVTELERNFRLNEAIMKFMTILLDADVTVQQLEEEVLQLKERASAASATEAADAADEDDDDSNDDDTSQEDDTDKSKTQENLS